MDSQIVFVPALLAIAAKEARVAPGLELAMAEYERGRFLEAEAILLAAAHSGHAHAQELLGFMYAIGPDLYPGIWRRLDAARNWFSRAAVGGRVAARKMHAAFTRHGTHEVRAWIIEGFAPLAGRDVRPQASAGQGAPCPKP
jgi:TPR repeat protein